MSRRRPLREPAPDAVRLFVAADVPTRVQVALGTQMVALAQARADVRWARSEQMHVTLKFVGETAPDRIDSIRAALREVRGAPFEVGVRGLGRFPEQGAPRIVWAGIDGDVDALTDLADRIERTLARVGVPREGRPYRPHMTLGRVKSAERTAALDARIAERSGGLALAAFPIGSFRLYRSELHPSGAVYTVIEEYPLTPDGDPVVAPDAAPASRAATPQSDAGPPASERPPADPDRGDHSTSGGHPDSSSVRAVSDPDGA